MRRTLFAVGASLLAIGAPLGFRELVLTPHAVASVRLTPVAHWSLEAQRVIVPPPAGVGNKFPGEAAVYMGIVHVAMYDAAVAIQGRYRPYAIALRAPGETSPAAAIATAAHRILVVLLPTQRGDLDNRYADYVSKLPDNAAKTNGIAVGEHVAAGIAALRADDGRNADPSTFSSLRRVPASLNLIAQDRCSDFGCRGSGRSRSTAPGSFALMARLR